MTETVREIAEARAIETLATTSIPEPHPDAGKIRILWVFAWLAAGDEETEVRALARGLDPTLYRIDALPCFRREGVLRQSHDGLRALGIHVDETACALDFAATVAYLRHRLAGADVVIASQDVADIYPALEGMACRPPLIEHGKLVREAEAGPKHFTMRYVGVCDRIRAAAAARMADRPHHAVEIPSVVDLTAFSAAARRPVRAGLGVAEDAVLVGWAGRPGGESRVEDFIRIAASVAEKAPEARFVVIGGTDALLPGYGRPLRALARGLGLSGRLALLGARVDRPGLMAAFDVFCWLDRDEGMSHAIAEAGTAGLPVVTWSDSGASPQVRGGETGLLVPYEHPEAVSAAMLRLIRDAGLRRRLGEGLRVHVRARHATDVVVPQWERLIAEVLAERVSASPPATFASPILGGWESSTHVRRDGRRLDVIAAIGHDAHAAQDYRQLADHGIRACRDGIRWHLIDRDGRWDFASLTPMLEAARDTGTQVVWDLMHYGWPDGLDIWSPAFVNRFAAFAGAVGRHARQISDSVPFWCPVNEIGFHSWAGGDARYLNPFATGRGFELKVQLARASIAAMRALLDADPRARFLHAEPVIAVHHADRTGRPRHEARGWHESQFQAMDMIAGRLCPEIGGEPRLLDLAGANYYYNNQWIHGDAVVDVDDRLYRPLSDLLFELGARYGRPVVVAETGIEGPRRASWFRYVQDEVARARSRGVRVEGICLYPVADHPGWDDDRACPNGLLGPVPGLAGRAVHAPLAAALGEAG